MIYDLVQKLAGRKRGLKILNEEIIAKLNNQTGTVLDIGGGTGSAYSCFKEKWKYICLERDKNKIRQLRKKYYGLPVFKACASAIPCKGDTFDLCVMIAVAHHLNEKQLEASLSEVSRVLKNDGKFLFLDPVLKNGNRLGALLWMADRGAYPRKTKDLMQILQKKLNIIACRRYRIFHDYLLIWASKAPL